MNNDIHDDNEHLGEQRGEELPPIRGLESLRMVREPEQDLWPAIQARIQSRAQPARVERLPPPRRRWVPLAAAAAMTAVIAGLIGLRQLQTAVPAAAPTTVAAVPAQPDAGLQTVAMTAPSGAQMQGANRALLKANLKIVKSAEDQLRQALATDPNDRYLQNLLLSTQTQKQHLRGLLDRQLI
ncbi:MAG: hypothetical protein JWQ90_2082 [Hydrocarboniphaga sp.]|uniref:hypothetical protein n=1 Tax=Hydrocarboniphaga sp. TaxID=2033016 RepID=UPI00260CDDA6|nr:hypothetical protein [Hydrocarboniphaga sp.]MDB5969632.1 hypothetical protein [Hydrocarboniphaga sp.]